VDHTAGGEGKIGGFMAILTDPEAKTTLMMLVIGIFIGLIAGQLAWDHSEKHPDYVMPVGDRVIVVIKEYGKSAYIYASRKDHFAFEAELRPNSAYYPMPEKEVMGHKAYAFNPKFNEWIEDWKIINKVD
jgi:hypothetical protein